ncbi:MAG: acetyl-CoA C-acyltransferase [Euryarchaeota archaeon]|nr:acetyl-CoA C-acyltransferase [Euryarchaeota archaeon]|tara:strand:+ start:7087 stop:8217 length:1131 start_codon:yes stop_codon:yes gene_type:complete
MRAVIVDWMRSPFHRAHKGKLSETRPDELLGQVTKALLDRNPIDLDEIDDIIVGCAYPEGEQGYNIGRLVTFLGGIPDKVPGMTINRLCGSSMQAILTAASHIESGWGDCFLCGGIESMSRIKRRGFSWSPHPDLEKVFPDAYINMGITAENVAENWDISRVSQEEFALDSHMKSIHARDSGYFKSEICPISTKDGVINQDGCIRDTSLESMSKLKAVFKDNGSVTAATSSPLTDGAVCMLVCSSEFAEKNGLEPLARIVTSAVTGCPPDIMGIGPISSTQKALERSGWNIDEVDIFEINEAFSSQSIAVINELSIDYQKVNIDGGAISLGHPLGASGARIVGKAASILNRTNSERAVATMCIGGGMGITIALERP